MRWSSQDVRLVLREGWIEGVVVVVVAGCWLLAAAPGWGEWLAGHHDERRPLYFGNTAATAPNNERYLAGRFDPR